MHHWEHGSIAFPALQLAMVRTKLFLRRFFRQASAPDSEGCSDWEMSYIVRIEMLKQFEIESQKPRNYEHRGLRRCRG